MSLILLMACNGGSLKNGGSPSTISIIIMPKEDICINRSTQCIIYTYTVLPATFYPLKRAGRLSKLFCCKLAIRYLRKLAVKPRAVKAGSTVRINRSPL